MLRRRDYKQKLQKQKIRDFKMKLLLRKPKGRYKLINKQQQLNLKD